MRCSEAQSGSCWPVCSGDVFGVPVRPIRIVLAGPLFVLAMRGLCAPERRGKLQRRGECGLVRTHASRQSMRNLLDQPDIPVRTLNVAS
jgi:hypothetical protein